MRSPEQGRSLSRGALTLFLGAVPGSGKTFAMLQLAQRRRAAGIDVVIGAVNTHGRPETEHLLEGLERLPRPAADGGGLDLDAALARRPVILLVDDLAAANPAACRHPRRWQDVEELLGAGIAVWSTLNVYELESLKDVASRVTEVPPGVTVPDRLVEQADEVRLVDVPAEELLERLAAGKIHVPGDAAGGRRVFRPGTLLALREMALRRTADHVDARMRRYRRDHAIQTTWPVSERVLACVSPSPHAPHVVRAAKRFADTLRAEWLVVYVETPAQARRGAPARARVMETLRLAEQLGAETAVLSGERVADAALALARSRNASKIVVGKPRRPAWRRLVSRSIPDALVRAGGETDIYVISGEESPHVPYIAPRVRRRYDWAQYGWPVLVVAACTALNLTIFPYMAHSTLALVYLLGVVAVAARSGPAPSVVACVLSVAAFDFFFVPPYFTFAVAATQDMLAFAVMFVVALVISGLTVRIRWHADSARERERRTAALYALSRDLAVAREVPAVLEVAVRHIAEVFGGQVAVLLPQAGGSLRPAGAGRRSFSPGEKDLALGEWVYLHRRPAGLGTDTASDAPALYLPLAASRGTIGVLAIRPDDDRTLESPAQTRHLESFGSQVALALERAQLEAEAQQAQLRMETESMRSSLLSSVSHDLRTPLATITGTATTLLEAEGTLDPTTRRGLLETLCEEAGRLNRLVRNLLDMTRLQSGSVQIRKEWHPLEEIVGVAVARVEPLLSGHSLAVDVAADLPLVPLDDILIEQVLINLLENAAKHTPPGTAVHVRAAMGEGGILVEVADTGPGIPAGEESKIFEKFYRGPGAAPHGAGLGLAICRGVVEAHGGRIWAENRPGKGAAFRFTLPLAGSPPDVEARLE
ncbi:MAG: DUF4118 domain-containing protein [Candidatus Methylomirabilales bacterium]